MHAPDLFKHASHFHEKLINEAQVGLEAFPHSLTLMTRELVLPFVQLFEIPDPSYNLAY